MKTIVKAAGVVTAVALSLTACSNPGAGRNDGGAGVTADGTAKVKAKELTVWTNAADTPAIRDVYKRFGDKFGVKMNIVSISADAYESQVQTKWASGDRPDILEYHATSLFWALNPAKNLVDMSRMPYVAKSGKIYDVAGSLEGKVYAAITDTPALMDMFYNKKLFEKYGLQAPKTYADIESICTTLKKKAPSVAPIWESGGSVWPTQILGGLMYMGSAQKSEDWADQVLKKKTTFDAPGSPYTAALEEYKKLHDMGCFNKDATTAKFEDSVKAVSEGTAAMVALHSGLISMFNDQFGGDTAKTDATIGFAYPSADGAVSAWAPNLSGTWYVPKTGDGAKESTALAFIQYATGAGYQDYVNATKTFPVLDGATPPTGVQGLAQQVADAYKDSSQLAFNSNLIGYNSQGAAYLTGILSGSETPADAAKKSQKAFEQAATAAGLPGW
ncbi:ABC transporter substrate-binding protein [Streptomyces griseorubiginosus]|uniref:ABC transporter substrate-binding protein n=1 Tax=Streptomyces griseorubiginosus TaxID=67304 RepID=UPI003318C655